MKKLRNSLTKILKKYFGNGGNDDGDNSVTIQNFEGDLYEDLREDLCDEIINDRLEAEKYNAILNKIQMGMKLTGAEQKKAGILQL